MKRPAHRMFFLLSLAGVLSLPSCSGRGISMLSTGGYNFDRQGETASRHEEGEIPSGVRRVRLDHHFGKVRIEVSDGSPQWSWDLTCWASTAETAKGFTEQIAMQIDEEGDRHSWTLVLPEPPVPALRGVESKLTLSVPAAMEVDVTNRFGQTEILGVQGGTVARCKHGKVQLSDLGGKVAAGTSFAAVRAERISGARLENQHGAIHATDVQGDLDVKCEHGEVVVHGVSGDLKVENAHGKVIADGIAEQAEISTSFQDIQLEDAGGKVRLRNQHGNISARRLRGNVGVENQFGRIDLGVDGEEVVCKNQHGGIKLYLTGSSVRVVRAETSFGGLQVNVSESMEPKIEAQAIFGKVKSDLPVAMMGTGADNFRGLDMGVARITLKVEHGNIEIKRSAKSDSGS